MKSWFTLVLLLLGGALNCLSQCCPPTWVAQPVSTTNLQGTTATFWVIVNSGTTVTYQWKLNGINIPGATGTNYVISNVQSGNAGNYSCGCTNSAGGILSSNAVLTVLTPGTLQFSSATYSFPESVAQPLITVTRTGGSYGAASVSYATLSGTATGGVDYTDVSGTLSWTNGETASKTFNVPLINDTQAEGDETFTVKLTNAIGASLGTGSNATVKIVDNDVIAAWGDDSGGQCDVPPGLSNIRSLAAGFYHSLVLSKNGVITPWGADYAGQISVPADLTNATAISAGAEFSVALRPDGTVTAWGDGSSGQTNIPPGLNGIQAIAAGGYHCLALGTNAQIIAWGDNTFDQAAPPPALNNIVAVAAGLNHSLALKDDGTVIAWGDDGLGQTDVPVGLNNVVAVAGGHGHSVALKSNGTIVAWGYNGDGETNVPPGLSNVVAISAGFFHNVALKSDGTMVALGDNVYGQWPVPAGLTNFTAISAGGYHSLALKGNGGPFIGVQPFSQTRSAGGTATFMVMAGGKAPLSYQWRKNGINVAGTNSSYTLANLQISDAASYSVVITNSVGSITSAPAVLTVTGSTAFSLTPLGFTNTGFRLQLTGPPGTYIFDASSNLSTWTPFSTNSVLSGVIVVTDPAALTSSHRFYRARQ